MSFPMAMPTSRSRVRSVSRSIRWLCSLCLGLLCGIALPPLAEAQEGAERLAYEAALRDFDLGQWDRAAGSLGAFSSAYPGSSLRTEVESRLRFAEAERSWAAGDWSGAARSFSNYLAAPTPPPLAAVAAVRLAQCRLKEGDPTAALEILQSGDGPFVRALRQRSDPSLAFRGLLTRAEALRALRKPTDAIIALQEAEPMASNLQEKALRWRALAGLHEDAGQPAEAARAAEAWGRILVEEGLPETRAEANALAGRLWRLAGDRTAAEAAHARNLSAETPLDRQREATLALADLAADQSDWTRSRERLENYLASHPEDPNAAEFQLRLGQSLLQQFLSDRGLTNAPAGGASLLTRAIGQFTEGLKRSPAPPVVGQLRLGRGWALWESLDPKDPPERIQAAAADFEAALPLLSSGWDASVARFKLADAELRLGNPAKALKPLRELLRDAGTNARVQQELVPKALVQAAQAAVGAREPGPAREAAEELIQRRLPEPGIAPSVLTVSQFLADSGDPEAGRTLLRRFLKEYPSGTSAPEAELGLAAIELRARAWGTAVGALDHWIATHPDHPRMPQAEFDRAWAMVQAGLTDNAIARFTEIATRFPTNHISQTASLWLADHYFSQGDFAQAERLCVNLLTNTAWRGSPQWHEARLRAAESARRRQSAASAREQFLELLNDRTTPTQLLPQAYLALGETHVQTPEANDATPVEPYRRALEAFTAAAQFTNSPVSIAALGRMADCHLQLATQSTNSYAKADELYRRIIASPKADLSTRSKASVGLGVVSEKLAALQPAAAAKPLLEAALNHYLDVVNGTLSRPGEVPDPWWLKEAGREAGRLLESAGRWREASTLYDRLASELPALKATLELRSRQALQRIQQ
ncbi:MAG: putative TPR-repeat protein [Verrucomicrobiota bacterium]